MFELIAEPESLDPTVALDPGSAYILPALFEGLTARHPRTGQPTAALGTHYERSANQTRYTFYLRGHGNPRGTRLPNTDDLDVELHRNYKAPPDRLAARWSDGHPITAHDFVYSWRRAADPQTGAPYAFLVHSLKYGREITAGKRPPDELGVRAVDDFTLEIELEGPTSFFLDLAAAPIFYAVPRRAIEAFGPSWSEPGHIVTSGPFTLKEWRPYDCVIVVRNPRYYEAPLVALDEIRFVSFADRNSLINFYKSGEAQAMSGFIPPMIAPYLVGKRDFHSHWMFGTAFLIFNTTKPPFDNVLLRYAFNMALDKRLMAEFQGPGRRPARTLVPAVEGYDSPNDLPIEVNGRMFDVLSFDPPGARELLSAAGFPNGADTSGRPLRIEYLYPASTPIKTRSEIVQQQWRQHLGIDVQLVVQDFSTYLRTTTNLEYNAVAHSFDSGYYLDPNWFLSQFMTGSSYSGTGWSDPKYDLMLNRANELIVPAERMHALASCERYLLAAMPVVPIYFDAWSYLQKPYVHGGGGSPFDTRPFKYTWIDTNWRPA